jgi:DNA-binding MarR family transcriptional regulator
MLIDASRTKSDHPVMKRRSLIRELERATHRVGAYLDDQLRPLGIGQAEAHVLALLADEGAQPVSSLVAAFGHRPSTLTSVLARLERRGLIERRINPDDRRSFIIELSKAGVAVAARVEKIVASLEMSVAAGLPPSSIEGFFETTDSIGRGRPSRS